MWRRRQTMTAFVCLGLHAAQHFQFNQFSRISSIHVAKWGFIKSMLVVGVTPPSPFICTAVTSLPVHLWHSLTPFPPLATY